MPSGPTKKLDKALDPNNLEKVVEDLRDQLATARTSAEIMEKRLHDRATDNQVLLLKVNLLERYISKLSAVRAAAERYKLAEQQANNGNSSDLIPAAIAMDAALEACPADPFDEKPLVHG